jgi:hypothetical protein
MHERVMNVSQGELDGLNDERYGCIKVTDSLKMSVDTYIRNRWYIARH